MEGHDASRANAGGQMLESFGRTGQVHEHEPADQGVEVVPQVQGPRVPGHEFDIVVPGSLDASPSRFQDPRVDVHAHDLAFRTH